MCTHLDRLIHTPILTYINIYICAPTELPFIGYFIMTDENNVIYKLEKKEKNKDMADFKKLPTIYSF